MEKEISSNRFDRRPEMDERVLVMLRDSGNAGKIAGYLREAGLTPVRCHELAEVCGMLREGSGLLLVDDRSLLEGRPEDLDRCLLDQPAWSSFPVVLISSGQEALSDSVNVLGRLESRPFFSVLSSPVANGDLVEAVEAALHKRRRQYEMRELLEESREREDRFRAMVDSAIEYGIISLDTSGNITSWNAGARRVLGYSEEEVVGKSAALIFTEEDNGKEALAEEMRRALTDGVAKDARWHVRRDGSRFWADGQMNPIFGPDGEVKGYTKILRDSTGQRRTESWLKALNETLEKRVEERTAIAEKRAGLLRRLANELTNAEQRERRRLAQVLHDHLQQLLVAAKMQVGMLVMREEDRSKEEHLHQVEDLIKRSIDTSRSLTVELSPPILYDAGLGPALEWLARRMQETHGLRVELRRETDLNPPEENVRVFLFEATRELLFNVVKHSGVTEAEVVLRQNDSRHLEVAVADRGKGLDATETGMAESGFGLFSIRERIELLGGSFALSSEPGGGTRLFLCVPISKEWEREEVEAEEEHEELAQAVPSEGEPVARAAPAREKVRILLADDHKILREGLAGLLREQPDFDVVSEASDGQMAVDLAQETKPDVIIMDVTMPRLNGIDATRRILQEMPGVKVIGLSMHEKADMAQAMREAGAIAYVTKGAPSEILTATIRDCAAGRKAS